MRGSVRFFAGMVENAPLFCSFCSNKPETFSNIVDNLLKIKGLYSHKSVPYANSSLHEKVCIKYRIVYNSLQYGTILYNFFLYWSRHDDPARPRRPVVARVPDLDAKGRENRRPSPGECPGVSRSRPLLHRAVQSPSAHALPRGRNIACRS